MNQIKKSALAALSAAIFSLSFSSCGKTNVSPDKANEETAETTHSTETQTTSSLPEGTAETQSATATMLTVTDSSGNTVTVKDSQTVTGISSSSRTTSEHTKAVTAPQTTPAAAKTTDAAAQTSPPPVTDAAPPETDPTPPPAVPCGEVKFTWLCDGKGSTICNDGQLVAVTFKIKENVPVGDYGVSLSSADGSDDGGYVSYDGKKRRSEYNGGVISVGTGSIAPENQPASEGIYTNLTNASGNAGDIVTMYIDISNNYYYDMMGFSFKLEFDANVLEIQSITQGSIFDNISKGTFMTSLESAQ